jgi:hypothetical protein
MSGNHAPGRSDSLNGLNASLLVDANRMDSLFLQPLRRRSIGHANLTYLLFEGCRVFWIGVEPIATFVRLEFRRLLKNVRLVGRKW